MRSWLLVLGFVSACDSPEAIAEWEMHTERALATTVPLSCPTDIALPVGYDGIYDEDHVFFRDSFWLGAGSCRGAKEWEDVQASLREAEAEAIRRCQNDAVVFRCAKPCSLLTAPGTCEITESTVGLVSENPPAQGSDPWSCTMRMYAKAEATDAGACQMIDVNKDSDENEDRSE